MDSPDLKPACVCDESLTQTHINTYEDFYTKTDLVYVAANLWYHYKGDPCSEST